MRAIHMPWRSSGFVRASKKGSGEGILTVYRVPILTQSGYRGNIGSGPRIIVRLVVALRCSWSLSADEKPVLSTSSMDGQTQHISKEENSPWRRRNRTVLA